MNVTLTTSDLAHDKTPAASHPERTVDGLTRLHDAFEADLSRVNELIIERMDSPVAMIPQLARYVVAAGGKRLRPLLTLACADLAGYTGDRHYGLAACVEFIHTATLLHDDVVDDSSERRGKASANAVFGNQASVLVGDFLFTRAFELMVADGSLDVLSVLSKASATIAEGEVMQLATTNNIDTTEQQYLDVISGKTAVLFAAACEVGGLVAALPGDQAEKLRDFGHNLGMAFQLIDDVLDYGADRQDWGKEIGDDFREGKMTLPVVLAIDAAKANRDQQQVDFWQRTVGDLDQQDGDLDQAMAYLSQHGCLQRTRERAQQFATHAIAAIQAVKGEGQTHDLLIAAVSASIDRRY
ncbi:MAG: polyprenyl synthetase family protein [Pseudomonadota bacterium]